MYGKQMVVLERESCKVLSASTEAYAFIGSRYYYAFDQLVFPADLEEFRRRMAECDEEIFSLRLMNAEDHASLFIASIGPSVNPQAVTVILLPAEKLGDLLSEQQRRLERKNLTLSIYGDEFFEYSVQSDIIRVYRVDKYEQTIAEIPLKVFFDRLRSFARPKDLEAVERFCSDFVSRQTFFTLQAEGHLLDDKPAEITIIKANSLFVRGVYVGAAGLLHFGQQRHYNSSIMHERDSLTGLMSKADITGMAINMIDVRKTRDLSVLIVDVDRFKDVNDLYGHMMGDEVLRRIASILRDEVGGSGMVGRIGGDEFMVLCFHMSDMEDHRALLRSIKNRVAANYPENDPVKPCVTLSIGCASCSKDADTYEQVFRLADYAMYRAKHNGRNRYVIFDKEKHGDPEEILAYSRMSRRTNNRGDLSVGDIICSFMSRAFSGQPDPVDRLLEDAALDLGLQRIMLYAGKPWRVICMAGEQRPDAATLRDTIGYLDAPELQEMYDENGVMVLDDVERIRARGLPFYEQMKKQGILSCIHFRGTDADGQRFLLSFESVSRRVTWNPEWIRYYALFQRILREYKLS